MSGDGGKAYPARSGDPLGAIVETVRRPLLVLSPDLSVETANRAFLDGFGVTLGETAGRPLAEIGDGGWRIEPLLQRLAAVAAGRERLEGWRVEHDFPRIGRRAMILSADRMTIAGRGAAVLLDIEDVTERERLLFELGAEREFAEKLIDSIREGLLVLDETLTVRSANHSFYEGFRTTPQEAVGRKVYELGDGEWDIPELRRLLEGILPRESAFDDFEVDHAFEGLGQRAMLLNARMLDHTNMILLAIRDVTDQRRAEAARETYLAEMQHRIHNILSNVSALAGLTRRGSATLDEFYEAFTARIRALARAQELLVAAPDRALSLESLLAAELDAVGAVAGRDFNADGPMVELPGEEAQVLAMVFHELATNAGKYGALAGQPGSIAVTWRKTDGEDGAPWVELEWRESGMALAQTERTSGFGSRAIEWSVQRVLHGRARLDLLADGACCTIAFPLPHGAPRAAAGAA